jgi:hypothetical protein
MTILIETGTSGFINEVLSPTSGLTLSTKDYAAVKSIEERRLRLTFILATSYTFTKTTKTDLLDNTFYLLKQN